jgi:hypothetical protein
MPTIRLIASLPAILVIARYRDSVVVLVDADQPAALIRAIARPLLKEAERKALSRALAG